MKFEKNPKYNTFALFALIVVAFAALLISLFTHAAAVRAFFAKMARVLMPLLYAAILMLVLMPAVEFFERKFLPFCIARQMKKPEKKASTFALIVTFLLLIVVVLLSIVIIIPQFSVLYDTVLGRLPDAEIESIVAHELGHVATDDVLTGTLTGALGAAAAIALPAQHSSMKAMSRRLGSTLWPNTRMSVPKHTPMA